MHICFIEDTLLHGGSQIWVTEAICYFLARGERVTLLAPEGGWVARQVAATEAQLVTYNYEAVVNQDAFHQQTWTAALHNCEVALCTVHPPRRGFHCSVFAARCIKAGRLKTFLISKTGTIVPHYRRQFYLPHKTTRSSIIAIADFTRTYLIDAYQIPPDRVSLIYQGVDSHRFKSTPETRAEALKRYPLPENAGPILGCLGSFEHRKGQPILFEAIASLVSDSLANIYLLLVGDGPDEAMLREQVKLMGLEKQVAFFPFTRRPQYVFERIDMTILPSLYKEGLPNVLLESMAMNVPVIASRLGGVPEVVLAGQTGYTVKVGDSKQLAAAINRLWANQQVYRQMCEYTRQFIKEKFDKNTQFEQFLNYFKRIRD